MLSVKRRDSASTQWERSETRVIWSVFQVKVRSRASRRFME